MRGEYSVCHTALYCIYRITPACAGNTLDCRLIQLSPWDHPRLRGEYFHTPQTLRAHRGSPPLARGIPTCLSAILFPAGITPACAGNTVAIVNIILGVWDHPRLRGEYRFCKIFSMKLRGSPPLARGIQISKKY